MKDRATAPEPRAAEIKRYLRPEQRTKWEKRLAAGFDESDDYPAAEPIERALLCTLLELKDAERIIAESRVTAPVGQPRDLNLAELKQFWQSESEDEFLSVAEMVNLIDLLIQENAEVKAKLSNEYRASIGEVWHWQADEFDQLESLTCPILISADAMRAALAYPPQIAQPWTDRNLYDAYLCGYCEDDRLPEPMSMTMFLAQFTGGK